MKEIKIADTNTYAVYKLIHGTAERYAIEYKNIVSSGPTPWYKTLRGVQEALYYAGLTESKDLPIG